MTAPVVPPVKVRLDKKQSLVQIALPSGFPYNSQLFPISPNSPTPDLPQIYRVGENWWESGGKVPKEWVESGGKVGETSGGIPTQELGK